jgi:ribosomal protein S18 acetylase RimI-like enzyme
MHIRRYIPGEEDEIWALYYNTTHRIVAREYTEAQVNRWAPPDVDRTAWARKLARTNPFVATESGRILGFAELEEDGHIANFYCHHQRQGEGIGTALLRALEAAAADGRVAVLRAEVSTVAAGFFEARGFRVIEERTNTVCGSPARQFIMEKSIATADTGAVPPPRNPSDS